MKDTLATELIIPQDPLDEYRIVLCLTDSEAVSSKELRVSSSRNLTFRLVSSVLCFAHLWSQAVVTA